MVQLISIIMVVLGCHITEILDNRIYTVLSFIKNFYQAVPNTL